MAGATLHDARQVGESLTVTMSGKHVMTLIDPKLDMLCRV